MREKQKAPQKRPISFLKIDITNREQLTESLINQIREMNTIEKTNPKTFGKGLIKKLASGKTHMYLAFERDPHTNKVLKNNLLGVVYGELNGSSFYLSRFFVNKSIRKEGVGLKLLLHSYAHIIHKLKATKINMISYPGTSNINEKIVGRRYITIFKDGKPTEVLRKFNSSYTASLSAETEKGSKLKKESIKITKKNKIKKRVL